MGRAEIEEIYKGGDHVQFEEILDAPITLTELESHIKELKINKSTGHDSILNQFIINAPLNITLLVGPPMITVLK